MAHLLIQKTYWFRGHREIFLNGLEQAIKFKHMDLIQRLRGISEILFLEPIFLLSCAARHGFSELVKLLLEEGVSPSDKPKFSFLSDSEPGHLLRSPLACAISSGNRSIINLLLNHGFKFDEECLFTAVSHGSQTLTSLIFSSGITTDTDALGYQSSSNLLAIAFTTGKPKMVRFLLDTLNWKIDGFLGFFDLLDACRTGKSQVVRAILELGDGRANTIDKPEFAKPESYKSLISVAYEYGFDYIVEILKEAKAEDLSDEAKGKILEERKMKKPWFLVDEFVEEERVKRAGIVMGVQRVDFGGRHRRMEHFELGLYDSPPGFFNLGQR